MNENDAKFLGQALWATKSTLSFSDFWKKNSFCHSTLSKWKFQLSFFWQSIYYMIKGRTSFRLSFKSSQTNSITVFKQNRNSIFSKLPTHIDLKIPRWQSIKCWLFLRFPQFNFHFAQREQKKYFCMFENQIPKVLMSSIFTDKIFPGLIQELFIQFSHSGKKILVRKVLKKKIFSVKANKKKILVFSCDEKI